MKKIGTNLFFYLCCVYKIVAGISVILIILSSIGIFPFFKPITWYQIVIYFYTAEMLSTSLLYLSNIKKRVITARTNAAMFGGSLLLILSTGLIIINQLTYRSMGFMHACLVFTGVLYSILCACYVVGTVLSVFGNKPILEDE